MVPIIKKLTWAVRWRVRQRLQTQRLERLAREVQRREPPAKTPPVVFFNASTRLQGMSLNAAFSLLAAWSLRLAGTPVVQYVCKGGMSRCVLGTSRDKSGKAPPCKSCIAQSMRAYSGAGVRWFTYAADPMVTTAIAKLSLAELMNYRRDGMPLGELVLPSLRWVLRRQTLDGDPDTCYLLRHYILSAWCVAQQFGKLLDEVKPMKVVVFNGMFFPEAAARWVARKRGIPVITHEVALRPNTGYFTNGEATAYPIDIPDNFELSLAQNQQLDEYLEQRFQGNFSMAGVRFWPEMKSLDPEFLERIAGFKQVVPVFTNVVFDTSQGHANVIFPQMFAWLDAVLAIIRAHPETFFVIRAHPDETRPGKESLESVAMWARKNKLDQLPNVLFVDSRSYFSSYELIQRSKFVMVYNSTIGLEASLLGAAVLCGGKARFTQLPTVYFPQSQNAFRRQAEEFLSAEKIEPPAEHCRNARRFLYTQLFKTSLPFGDFIEEDGIRKGYVRLKNFQLDALFPEKSATMRVILNGILNDGSFLLEG
jgi:hypothetical protein